MQVIQQLKMQPISLIKASVTKGAYIQNQTIMYRNRDGISITILDQAEVKLKGDHNLENALAAVAAALEAGAELTHIQNVLRTFEGVPHRLQFIKEWNGISFYNDSKATNSLATIKSIESFDEPIILIAGGLDRGEMFQELEAVLANKVKGLIVFGQIADKLVTIAQKAGVKLIHPVDNVREAVQKASLIAEKGDVVLLSPAAASWDQFRSFEERGDMFIQSVHKLR